MNAQDWMLSVTGAGNCPPWCSADHTEEDPEHDSVIHESAPITVQLPPLINGERLRLALVTVCSEDYRTQDEGRSPARVELGTESDKGAVHDYVPVPSADGLDKLIIDLRHAASALEQWRDRLPATA
ncbi:MAG: hypothetical protein JO362_01770 [Streptomycetaceae bacterium]|nr:hypothetical protein [Streptomycetaceae bacterium]